MKSTPISAAFSETEAQELRKAAELTGQPHTVAMREAALTWARKVLARAGKRCPTCGGHHRPARAA